MRLQQSRVPRCANCEYDLTGLDDGCRCPECGADTTHRRRDAILLAAYRVTVIMSCFVLVSSLAAEAVVLYARRQMEQPNTGGLPTWWRMLVYILVPIAAALLGWIGADLKRPPTRVVVWAGGAFWGAFAGTFVFGVAGVNTLVPLTAGFLVIALAARLLRRA